MFKIVRWVSTSGNTYEALFPESKALLIANILQEKGIQAKVYDYQDELTVVN